MNHAKNMNAGKNVNKATQQPALNDIEKMHKIFVNSKYKTFAETAMEYYRLDLPSPTYKDTIFP